MTGEFTNINDLLYKEADEILSKKGLLSLLKNFGVPHVTGSYSLNLMTWRDLDIYLETENLGEEIFFSLGAEINSLFNPVKMSYRNERVTRTKGLPVGLYWGVYLGNERNGAWKIDLWAVDANEYRKRLKFCDDIAAKLTTPSIEIILAIKSECWRDPEYRRSYSSKDIYEAVLTNKAKNPEEFKQLLKSKKYRQVIVFILIPEF